VHKVSEYGVFYGAENIKKSIYKDGPVACSIDATAQLEAYTGGVFSQEKLLPIPNHFVSIVGWGVEESGEEYWNVRNSWGTYWGEDGFFRIRMHKNNLGIELDCYYAMPIIEE